MHTGQKCCFRCLAAGVLFVFLVLLDAHAQRREPAPLAEGIVRVNLAAHRLIWDAGRQRLLAAVEKGTVLTPADEIAVVDPATGTIVSTIPVNNSGNPVTAVALSPDGAYLYAALEQNGLIRRFRMRDLANDLDIHVASLVAGPAATTSSDVKVYGILPIAGTGKGSLVVSTQLGVMVYDEAKMRGRFVRGKSVHTIFAGRDGQVIGYTRGVGTPSQFASFVVDDDGIRMAPPVNAFSEGSQNVMAAGNTAVSARGIVFDLARGLYAGQLVLPEKSTFCQPFLDPGGSAIYAIPRPGSASADRRAIRIVRYSPSFMEEAEVTLNADANPSDAWGSAIAWDRAVAVATLKSLYIVPLRSFH